MDNYEVKLHFSEHLESSVQFPNLENRTFENGKPSKIRNEALNYLKSILKKLLDEKILIFKNTDEELEAAFDEDLIKDENGELDLAKIHSYFMFFNNDLKRVSLFHNGKEIFRIGNIFSLKEYEEIFNNSKEEFDAHFWNSTKFLAFHRIPQESVRVIKNKIIQLKSIFNIEKLPDFDFKILQNCTMKELEKTIVSMHNSQGGVVFFKNLNPHFHFDHSRFDVINYFAFLKKIHRKISLEINLPIAFEFENEEFECIIVNKGEKVLKTTSNKYLFRKNNSIFKYDNRLLPENVGNFRDITIEEIRETLKIL